MLSYHAAQADCPALLAELETRTRAYLNGRTNIRRGALLYQPIGRWLAIAHAAPPFAGHACRLAQALCEEFPTLNGLRDALRQEGMLTDKSVLAKEMKPAQRGRKPKPKR